ncbi:MAG TPA: RIP metalloprotease RseP [Candidatus Limnocylindrales bacterium]|nr:RIP metalloprotease RseP [Candidatus Limnocylindrales bacterium]
MSSFSNFLFSLLAGAVVLGTMVLLHEWGHFVAAKLCSVRVDVFSIGFGPRLWGVKRGDTDYRLSALPLGGYVRMAGDNPAEERTGEPYEFLSRPRWQRFIIAVAGPAANIALTFLIFWGIIVTVGLPIDRYEQMPAQVAAVPSTIDPAGVHAGDQIVDVNGTPTPTWNKVLTAVTKAAPGDVLSIGVLRDGKEVKLAVPVPNGPITADAVVGYPALPPVADDIQPGFPAEKAGMKAGDLIVSMNGKPIVTWPQLPEAIRGSDGHTIHFVVRRDGKDLPIDVTPKHTMNPDGDMAWMIGAGPKTQEAFERESLGDSIRYAGAQTWLYTRLIGDIVKQLFRGKLSVRDLAGPVGIVQLSGQAAKRGPLTLLQWMAYISLDLGLLNLLPIPILDGGHVLLLAIEGSLRRDLSVAAKERFVQVGLVFLLGVFAFVMYSDILRLFQH